MDLLAIISAIIRSVTSLTELTKDIKNVELHRQISEFNLQVANIQNETAILIRENGTLKSELENLKNDRLNPLTYNPEDGLYYDNESKNPYCPNCYEGEKKERRHLRVDNKRCPKCNETFYEKHIGGTIANRCSWDPLE